MKRNLCLCIVLALFALKLVERDSLRKCIRPLSGESFSGHLMMIRTCRSF